ncbi:hypothetical protein QQY24_20380 [Streptomyces sp. TG1A-8]|uniref:hypothetical protein n=1 Tax=Streptomyces sp. TG1A-8 TaxID=3051385 RepID=UPI00265BE0A9|nr:hypothetical protein [Streptomyces sp. TG1A-8]MDO0927650.1 hypothetical protein [Streptomyces sp. TG1A-8]
MKPLKAVVVVAGSLALAGAAAPAFAHDAADMTAPHLNGTFSTFTKGPLDVGGAMPLQHQSDALNTENKGSVLSTAKGATTALNQQKLLGGLPLQH